MFCEKCGAENDDRNAKCVQCGKPLRAAPAAGSEGMIPYRNVCALVGCYLAVLSLLPSIRVLLREFGFILTLMGIPAFILGIVGLRHARQHPEAKGRFHAWVAIVLGGLCGLGWLALRLVGLRSMRLYM